MKIAVVGCGWLGLPLAITLVKKSYRVHGTSRNEEKLLSLERKGIAPHLLDSAGFKSMEWLKNIDILVLNIPPSDFKSDYGEKMLEISNNLEGSAKIIFVSSTSVYKNCDCAIDESFEAKGGPRNGQYVLDAEQKLQKKWGSQLSIIRMSGLVGENRHPVRFMSGRHYENGDNPVNLIHLEDCCGLIEAVIEQDFWGEVINGVCNENPSKEKYYRFAAEKLNIKSPTFESGKAGFKEIHSAIVGNVLKYKFKYNSPFDFPELS